MTREKIPAILCFRNGRRLRCMIGNPPKKYLVIPEQPKDRRLKEVKHRLRFATMVDGEAVYGE